jgi:hypothetical protein
LACAALPAWARPAPAPVSAPALALAASLLPARTGNRIYAAARRCFSTAAAGHARLSAYIWVGPSKVFNSRTTNHHGDDHHGRRRGKLSLVFPYPPDPVARMRVAACAWCLAAGSTLLFRPLLTLTRACAPFLPVTSHLLLASSAHAPFRFNRRGTVMFTRRSKLLLFLY